MNKYKCLCCGYRTLEERGEYEICPVCFWEDDAYLMVQENTIGASERSDHFLTDAYTGEDVLDIPSGANHGLTLRQGRKNYKAFGACDKEMLGHVRKPTKEELV